MKYTLTAYRSITDTITGDEVEHHAINALRNVRGESHLQTVLTAIADALEAGQTVTVTVPKAPDETVHTWADGFGRWHARVTFPGRGYGPQYLDAHIDRIRAKARRAIRRELTARGTIGSGYQVRVTVEANDLDHMNVMRSMTFAEHLDNES